MTIEFLYRGYNSGMVQEAALTPKSPKGLMESEVEFGDVHAQFGDEDFSFGVSIENAIRSHEYAQKGSPSGYLSFTPHFERAKYYALGDREYEEGIVIKVSVKMLRENEFQIFSVNQLLRHPSCKEDHEHSVYVGSRRFPETAIIEEIKVYRNEAR